MHERNIAVVYLSWLPAGINHFTIFIQSYINHSASLQHDLLILFNGVKDKNELIPYYNLLSVNEISFQEFSLPGGQDIKAYQWIANKIHHKHILFLNTYAEILKDNWLLHFDNAMKKSNAGIVGATGSWQSHYTTVFKKFPLQWEFSKPARYNYRKYKLFLKAFFYWQFLFKSFPSPHIRTSSFYINRETFLKCKTKDIKTKFDAYLFENGRKSLSNKLLKKGLTLIVIDKYGATFSGKEWKESNTFWINNQENLLIADNQTKLYEQSSNEEKSKLSNLAWG